MLKTSDFGILAALMSSRIHELNTEERGYEGDKAILQKYTDSDGKIRVLNDWILDCRRKKKTYVDILDRLRNEHESRARSACGTRG